MAGGGAKLLRAEGTMKLDSEEILKVRLLFQQRSIAAWEGGERDLAEHCPYDNPYL